MVMCTSVDFPECGVRFPEERANSMQHAGYSTKRVLGKQLKLLPSAYGGFSAE